MKRQLGLALVVLGLLAASCGTSSGPGVGLGSTSVRDTTSVPSDDNGARGQDVSTTAPSSIPEPATPDAATLPEDTGPKLQWLEVAVDTDFSADTLAWSGSSFLTLSHNQSGSIMMQSADGRNWSPVSSLPAGVAFWGIHASGESIVVWGGDTGSAFDDETDVTEPPSTVPPTFEPAGPFGAEEVRMFTSTDGGASWSDLGDLTFDVQQPASPYLLASADVTGAGINGNVVVVRVMIHAVLDVERVLADNGIDPDIYRYDGYVFEDGEISMCLIATSTSGTATPDFSCGKELTLTHEDLGLSAEEVWALEMGWGPHEIYRSVGGGPFTPAGIEIADGYADALLVVKGQFIGSVIGETGQRLYQSTDGLNWEQVNTSRTDIVNLTSDGTALYARSWSGSEEELLRSDDSGNTWTRIQLDSQLGFAFTAGPSGLAVSGELWDTSSISDQIWPISIEKDGHIVNFRDDGGLEVVAAGTGEIVLAFTPEDFAAGQPETIIEGLDGDLNTVTFLHPDTLEPLVTIDQDEMDAAFGVPEEYPEPEFFIGWSPDGEHWGWQTATQAFGANGGAQLAIGDGVVVALFYEFTDSEPTDGEDVTAYTGYSVRVFAAQVE